MDFSAQRTVIVAGSRDITNYPLVRHELSQILQEGDVIVSGTARGADQLGERYAKEAGLDVIRMPAEWDRYGRSAGYRRNEEMAKVADCLLAFWDGKSRGTAHMIQIAKEHGLLVKVVKVLD